MERKYPHLTSPITIAGVTFRNRMFSAPMGGTDITNDGCIGPKSTAFYELRAKGGAGAVTVSECMVHPKTDGSHAYHLDPAILNSLACATYTADAIRRHGAMPSLELSHSGMFAGTYMTDKSKQKGMNQWGPSDTVRNDGVEVKGLTKELIDEIVKSYGDVAEMAKRAGFEMIMIHGGHGWLINQFLSPLFNKRTDEYGGTYQKTFGITHPSMFEDHGRNVFLAEEIKKHVKVPVATIGGLNDPEQLEEIIASGKADIVYMGRALLADPYLPEKVTENRDNEIVHCLRCFTCMAERAGYSFQI